MHGTLSAPLAEGNLRALERPLSTLAHAAPPGYDRWSDYATAGARAAQASNVEDLRVACASCHRVYRARYRTERRDAPLPAALHEVQ